MVARGELAVRNHKLVVLLLEKCTAKGVKAEVPYAVSRYGKEYGTPATRLLFECTIGIRMVTVRTVSDILENKFPAPQSG